MVPVPGALNDILSHGTRLVSSIWPERTHARASHTLPTALGPSFTKYKLTLLLPYLPSFPTYVPVQQTCMYVIVSFSPRSEGQQRFFAAARKVALMSFTGLSHLDIPAHELKDIRRQVGRYFGEPEDTWRIVAGSSENGEWSRWKLDENRGEYRERVVTSVMEANILHFWTELPFVKDVPVHKVPKTLTLTGVHSNKVKAKIDYDKTRDARLTRA